MRSPKNLEYLARLFPPDPWRSRLPRFAARHAQCCAYLRQAVADLTNREFVTGFYGEAKRMAWKKRSGRDRRSP